MAENDPSLQDPNSILGIPSLNFIEKLGEGGMAVVWKAYDSVYERMVAVKILNEQYSENPEDVRHFREEHQLLEEVSCPGVVSVFDFNFANNHWYMTMEYIDGYDFASLLDNNGKVSESDCLIICESVAKTLDYVWNDHGIVHCDIKPDNLMTDSEGNVKLTDMGISYRYHAAEEHGDLDESRIVLGSPAYMSPEQICAEPLDCRADIYSLGATLYHLATGKLLFPVLNSDATMLAHCSDTEQAPDARTYAPQLSEGFVQLIEFMLVKDRDQRIGSWGDVYDMCRRIEEHKCFMRRESSSVSTMAMHE